MKTIVLNVEDLRERVSKLRFIQSQYENWQLKLHQVMINLEDEYKIDFQGIFNQSLDLTVSMQELSTKIGKLANILEERANMIENESHP